jgi:L-amino acid N-acyltransferase YncA
MKWFFDRLSYTPSIEFGGIIALNDDQRLGMAGLDHWTPNSVQVHVVSVNPKCLAPLWQEVLEYVGKHGRRLIYAVTPSDNERSLRLQNGLGFIETFRLKDAWSEGVDMIIREYRLNEQKRSQAA